MTTRAHKPLESFGPELLSALVEGSRREIIVHTTYKKAVKFRHRAYEMRSAMRAAKHTLYPLTVKTRIQILWGPLVQVTKSRSGNSFPTDKNTPVQLVFSPTDSEFADALADAGVKVRDIPLDPIPTTPPADANAVDPLEAYLPKEVVK